MKTRLQVIQEQQRQEEQRQEQQRQAQKMGVASLLHASKAQDRQDALSAKYPGMQITISSATFFGDQVPGRLFCGKTNQSYFPPQNSTGKVLQPSSVSTNALRFGNSE